jgi:autotransporter translocation and assembly factor TamB
MPLAKRLLLLILVLTLASLTLLFLTPFIVADGIRLFVLWHGNKQGVKIALGQIEAPLFRPVVIHRIHITSVKPCAFHLSLRARKATLDLNLRALFSRSGRRVMHGLAIENLQGEVRRVSLSETSSCHFDWDFLQQLLPDNLGLTNLDLQVMNGETEVVLRGVDLNASEIESGRFTAKQIRIAAPLIRKSFSDLRGATSWGNDRLTLGALSLAPDLDIETIIADFSRLKERRLAFELNLDAFGGKLRSSLASENRPRGIIWNVAGAGAGISLAQMSAALGLTEFAGGSVHALKFTFRGDPRNLSRATATIWAEVTGFTWRDRTAETIMLGASLHNRAVNVEQFYVKQRNNDFTLSGEYLLPENSANWLNPNFRADISASINDLGDFARLFGAPPNNFSGSLSVTGTMNGRDRNIGGHLMVDGKSLHLFKAPVETLRARLNLRGAQLIIEALEARRGDDFVRGRGEVDLASEHSYSGNLAASFAKMANYSTLAPTRWQAVQPEGSFSFEWKGHGKATQHSGDLRIQAQEVRVLQNFGVLPFDVRLDASYSPQNIFFREFQLSNAQALCNAFITLSPNYVQLQTVYFALNGTSKLHGNVFIPLAFNRWRQGGTFLDALDQNQNFGVDLTLDPIDLRQLDTALRGQADFSGSLDGRFELYGPLRSLQSRFEAHLGQFAYKKPLPFSVDLLARTASSSLNVTVEATASGSSHCKMEAILPLNLDRPNAANGNLFALDQPFSAKLDFPAVLLPRLPDYLIGWTYHSGILSGNLVASETLRHPRVVGDAQLINGRFVESYGAMTGLSGHLKFKGASASLEFANIELANGRLPIHGSLDFTNSSGLVAKLTPEITLSTLIDLESDQCVSGVNFFVTSGSSPPVRFHNAFTEVHQIELRGGISSGPWSLILMANGGGPSPAAQLDLRQTFQLCKSNGKYLQFGLATTQRFELGREALRILDGRRIPRPLSVTSPSESP